MPTPSRASQVRPLADQLGGTIAAPPAATTPRRRPKKQNPTPPAAPATTEPAPVDEAAQAPNPPLPMPATRSGARSTISKLIRFDADQGERLATSAAELGCSQTELVKSAVAFYLDMLDRERAQGSLDAG